MDAHIDTPAFVHADLAEVDAAPAAVRAVRYVVRAAASHWEVVFGEGSACFVYRTRAAAVRAARGAARRQWQARRIPGTVTLEEHGHAVVVASYGR